VPSGTEGYDDLLRRAHTVEAYGEMVPVADLDDIIRSKEAAGRPKDILHLPILLQTSDRLRDQREHPRRENERDTDLELGS